MADYLRMRKVHETVERLYHAAKELKGAEGPANVARLLNESPSSSITGNAEVCLLRA
ncbi:hypothetical protein C7S16_0881 [Burkholderia thailandensis]|uniref:Uncharacterized protein n=1 Tax=Burkholderia thailandensis TaxID=57975 RepID=A0AAW9D438_BURTH|nr:hypothetical protein [Burkholderia thailandensis]MDW9256376.1 hypothetical protein [Burkholderia thailandensis]